MSRDTRAWQPPGPAESLDDPLRRVATSSPDELRPAHFRAEVVALFRSAANPLVIILLIAGIVSTALGETTEATIITAASRCPARKAASAVQRARMGTILREGR